MNPQLKTSLLVGAWLLGAPLSAAAAAAPATGEAAYTHNCVQCHGDTLEGGEFGPPLKGATFAAHWQNQPGDALLQYIATKMPPAGPGSLRTQEYADIEIYIRHVTGGIGDAAGGGDAAAEAARAAIAERNARLFSASIAHDATYEAAVAARTKLLAGMSVVSEALLRNPPAGDWLHWRRTYDGLGFSTLAQINRKNVARLGTAWSWSLPPSMNEITPLVHDGVLYIASGAAVQALNATNGELLWQYQRLLPDEADGGRGSRTKSLAMLDDRVFAPTADGHMVALDARSGKLLWDHPMIAPDQAAHAGDADGSPFRLDGGPIVAHGKVILGVSLGVTRGKGGAYVVALDAQSGKEVWRFNTIAQPGEPGGDSWNGHPAAERYGAGVWVPGSYDPDLNLVYFGAGNTYATATLLVPEATERPENLGLYTDSTLALNADTGTLAWHYQHMGRDVWDLDWAFEQSLVTLNINGQARKLVVTGGKLALFDAVDRSTGEYVFSRDLGLQNVVQQIDPATGRKIINPAVQPEAGVTKLVCPYNTSGRNWPATAINPDTAVMFVPLAESCMNHTFTPGSAADIAAGGVDTRMEQRVRPDTDGKFGRLQAINLQTGKVLWTDRERASPSSAVLATAGGLVFNGNHDRKFRAYDDQTGAMLWETRLNAPPASFPITYAVNGEQYVAVVAGGGSALEATRATLTPEIDTPAGNPVLFVFKLQH